MRRRFIAIGVLVAVVVLAVAITVAVILTRPATPTGPVLIVGAGVAGASAAAELARRGEDFIILEARDVVGGRVQDAKLGNLTMEFGAGWVSSEKKYAEIREIMKSIQLKTADFNWTDRGFYSDGKLVEWAEEWATLKAAWRISVRKAKAAPVGSKEESLTEALKKYGNWTASTPLRCGMLQYAVDWEYAMPASRVSTDEVEFDWLEDGDPSDEQQIIDQRGFSQIVHVILRRAGINETRKSGPKLQLGAPVRSIESNAEGVRVVLKNGTVVNGRAALTTVSLGVLNSGSIEFKPPFSAKRIQSQATMAMGSYARYYIQFNESVLTADDPLVLIPTNCTEAINVQNLNKPLFFPKSNAVMVTFLGFKAERFTDKDKVFDMALNAVSSVTGRNLGKDLVLNTAFVDLDNSPYFKGAYTNRLVGFDYPDLEVLNKDHGYIHFAGEMYDIEDYGTVAAAFNTGKKQGARI